MILIVLCVCVCILLVNYEFELFNLADGYQIITIFSLGIHVVVRAVPSVFISTPQVAAGTSPTSPRPRSRAIQRRRAWTPSWPAEFLLARNLLDPPGIQVMRSTGRKNKQRMVYINEIENSEKHSENKKGNETPRG